MIAIGLSCTIDHLLLVVLLVVVDIRGAITVLRSISHEVRSCVHIEGFWIETSLLVLLIAFIIATIVPTAANPIASITPLRHLLLLVLVRQFFLFLLN